eukprot:TRINITY_DN28873_c0_g1_i1.p1 TRINITY_DN28873_c0_g1~~TRINITY_DN28873_c0_g1_i1.p1  ORF type:complete len:457 (-),score=144.99 TRINITY_DN28873_c0_g1_i1:28-1398(-)
MCIRDRSQETQDDIRAALARTAGTAPLRRSMLPDPPPSLFPPGQQQAAEREAPPQWMLRTAAAPSPVPPPLSPAVQPPFWATRSQEAHDDGLDAQLVRQITGRRAAVLEMWRPLDDLEDGTIDRTELEQQLSSLKVPPTHPKVAAALAEAADGATGRVNYLRLLALLDGCPAQHSAQRSAAPHSPQHSAPQSLNPIQDAGPEGVSVGQEAMLEALIAANEEDNTVEVGDLKKALEALERRNRVLTVDSLPAACHELNFLNNYVDELEGRLRCAVREVESDNAGGIKAKIRVKRVQHIMKQELARKRAEAAAAAQDAHESKHQVTEEAKAIIKQLSSSLSSTNHALRNAQHTAHRAAHTALARCTRLAVTVSMGGAVQRWHCAVLRAGHAWSSAALHRERRQHVLTAQAWGMRRVGAVVLSGSSTAAHRALHRWSGSVAACAAWLAQRRLHLSLIHI